MPGNNIKDVALLNAIYDATADAIIISDSSGIISGCNSAARTLFGYCPDELIGKNVSILMPASLASEHDGYIADYIETGQAAIIGKGRDVTGRRKDGSLLPLHLSIGKAETPGGIHFVAILHDITERVAAQAALHQAQKMEAVGRLSSGLSHDFNHILTIIIGNLELMQMQPQAAQFGDLLTDALEAAELGANLTSRLLAFASKSVLAPEHLDVNAALGPDTLDFLRRSLRPDHKLSLDAQPGIWAISADPALLQTAFLNLVLNAKDAMPDGGFIVIETRNVTVTQDNVEGQPDFLPGDYVRISVTDNGTGMPEHVLKNAFEPFFTTKPSGKGTGLGLPMVYGFVRQSGGHVEGRSEPGQGTSVSIYFPALERKTDNTAGKS